MEPLLKDTSLTDTFPWPSGVCNREVPLCAHIRTGVLAALGWLGVRVQWCLLPLAGLGHMHGRAPLTGRGIHAPFPVFHICIVPKHPAVGSHVLCLPLLPFLLRYTSGRGLPLLRTGGRGGGGGGGGRGGGGRGGVVLGGRVGGVA